MAMLGLRKTQHMSSGEAEPAADVAHVTERTSGDIAVKATRSKSATPCVCGGCMELIDVNQILPLIRRGLQVTHDCGKNLGKYEASTKS
jgi:hypothetical protein